MTAPLSSKLAALLAQTRSYVMTDEEREAQRQSFVRGQLAMSKADRAKREGLCVECLEVRAADGEVVCSTCREATERGIGP